MTFCSKVLELTREPTIIEKVPRWSRVELATHELGVTTRMGHLGLCLDNICVVLQECVNTKIKLAFMSKEERTAQ